MLRTRGFRFLLLVALVATMAPALAACSGGAADPGTLVVLTHAPTGEVRFLQMGSGKVTERIKVGGEPEHLVRDAARGRVYVLDSAGDSVFAIDVVSREVLKQIAVGREPRAAALSPDGKRLYVAVTGESALAILDLESLAVSNRTTVGGRPVGVAVSSDGNRVFVAGAMDNAIAIMVQEPSERRRMARSYAAPRGALGALVVTSDGGTLLSADATRPSFTALSLSGREMKEIPLTAAGGDVRAETLYPTPDGRYWLAGMTGSLDVLGVPVAGGDPITIEVKQDVSGYAVAPGGRVLASSREGEHLLELDLDKKKVTRRIRVGPGHSGLAVFSKSSLEALREQSQ